MGYLSKKTPFFTDNWSVGLNNIASIFNRKERKAFSKLKELYGYELVQNNKLQTSKPLSKEQKRIIKEKIVKEYRIQFVKNIISLIIALIIFILTAYIIVFFLNKGIKVY